MDLISRKAAIEACLEVSKQEEEHSKMWAIGLRYAKKILIELPSVPAVPLDAIDAAPVVHGRWIYENDDPLMISCSICEYQVFRYNNTPYCPSCGAKMDLE